ncbi:MAG: PadR family transcriptional regulator [Solirubrobacteraceae bacterium]
MPARDAGRTARLFVLGTLDSDGPTHGHEIRRLAERIDVESWSEAQIGSIYNALGRLQDEQLIEPIRIERQGRRPTRTVYAITAAGRLELASLRDKLLHEVALPSDPFDIALWVSAQAPTQELLLAIERRCASLQELHARLEHERTRLTAAGYLPFIGELLFRHGETRIEAELRWHQELRERIANQSVDAGGVPDDRTS